MPLTPPVDTPHDRVAAYQLKLFGDRFFANVAKNYEAAYLRQDFEKSKCRLKKNLRNS